MTRMYHRIPKIILATLTGTFALAAVSGIGLTTTTDLLPQRNGSGISSSMNLVLVGDNGLPCPANVIDGAVTLDSNKGGVQLGGNTIAGAVTANGNIASNGTIIENNHIGGKLTCNGNTPAPVNNGRGNTVSGAREGQTCASGTF